MQGRRRRSDTWQPYSEPRVAELVAQGKPVFVDFTAAWCVHLPGKQAARALAPETERAFAERGVTMLRADWTRRTRRSRARARRTRRSGVPVYVLYLPGREPRLLPEILTREALLAALAGLST